MNTQLGKSLCNFAGITSDNVDLGGQLTLTWEVTLQELLLTMLILGGGSINTQLGKSLCNFAGITSNNVDLGGGQSTFNLGSHFATLLGLLLTMLILGAGGSINTQLGKSLWNFAGITSDNVDPRGSIDTQLGKSLCNFAAITSDNFDPGGLGGQSILNLGSHFATLLGLPLTMLMLGGQSTQLGKSLCNFAGITSDNVDPGGSIDNQLGKSLCNFAGITSDNVYLGGVNRH